MDDDEAIRLRSVALKNADSIFLARQRAEEELVRTREALEARTNELAQANEATGRFVSMVSHELRTPLGAIGGYAALLEEQIHGPLTDEQRKFVARIRRNQQHLLRLVNELLDLARLESGQFPLKIERCPIRPVVEGVRAMIEPQVQASDLRLELRPLEEYHFLGDRDRVEQVVLNLVANAVKFTPAGGQITISITATKDDVFLRVADTGPGIPPGNLDEIFQPFVQVHSRSAAVARGTGLGLAISRELARAMGGGLSATSEIGQGSTFTLCLPRSD